MAHLAWGFGGRSSPDGGIFAKVDQGDRQALRVRRGRGAWRSSARQSRRQREGFARRGGPGKASGGSSKGGSAGRGDVERGKVARWIEQRRERLEEGSCPTGLGVSEEGEHEPSGSQAPLRPGGRLRRARSFQK